MLESEKQSRFRKPRGGNCSEGIRIEKRRGVKLKKINGGKRTLYGRDKRPAEVAWEMVT